MNPPRERRERMLGMSRRAAGTQSRKRGRKEGASGNPTADRVVLWMTDDGLGAATLSHACVISNRSASSHNSASLSHPSFLSIRPYFVLARFISARVVRRSFFRCCLLVKALARSLFSCLTPPPQYSITNGDFFFIALPRSNWRTRGTLS